jgi:hypothetical protein
MRSMRQRLYRNTATNGKLAHTPITHDNTSNQPVVHNAGTGEKLKIAQ